MECPFDLLPESILHDILCRLSIRDLLTARKTCVDWCRIVSSCPIFQGLYDQRNQEGWMVITSPAHSSNGVFLFNNNSNQWYLYQVPWFLQAAADGLMLVLSSEGKLEVINALTGAFRVLPDTRISQRLSLESCLKRKLLKKISGTTWLFMSMNIVVEPGCGTFKVIVWGQVRPRQVHVLVYSSLTDTWRVKLRSDIDYLLFQRPFHSTVDGNTIYYFSWHLPVAGMATYDTETDLFIVKKIRQISCRRAFGIPVESELQNIGVVAYKSRILRLDIMATGLEPDLGHPTAIVGLWEANTSSGLWELLTAHGLQLPSLTVVAAAYDGKHTITIIPGRLGLALIFLDLDTKEWSMVDGDPHTLNLLDGNAIQQMVLSIGQNGCNRVAFKAFHLKLKFCTALYNHNKPF